MGDSAHQQTYSIKTFLIQIIKPYFWWYVLMFQAPILTAFYYFGNNYWSQIFIDFVNLLSSAGARIFVPGCPTRFGGPKGYHRGTIWVPIFRKPHFCAFHTHFYPRTSCFMGGLGPLGPPLVTPLLLVMCLNFNYELNDMIEHTMVREQEKFQTFDFPTRILQRMCCVY